MTASNAGRRQLRAKGESLAAFLMVTLAEQGSQSHCRGLREGLVKRELGDCFSGQWGEGALVSRGPRSPNLLAV